jgi:HlyD family secretion protein
VLSRAVEPGQTVAATFQAPVLFTIAEDLAQMELEVAIDEADVGQVAAGQLATFSVDAWPGRTYDGEIVRVGLGAQELDGVVSYPALISVHNDDLSLRPGMTATADIVTVTRDAALLVPNAALRFDPTATSIRRTGSNQTLMGRIMARPSSSTGPATARVSEGRHVWVLRDDVPTQVEVTPRVSDGQFTEIEPGPLAAGTPVIVELASGSR